MRCIVPNLAAKSRKKKLHFRLYYELPTQNFKRVEEQTNTVKYLKPLKIFNPNTGGIIIM